MTLTIAIEGLGELDNAEATTNWGIAGSGGASISIENEIYYQGSNCIASTLSSGKYGWVYYNHGSALNFTTTYSGQYILVWFQIATPGSADTLTGANRSNGPGVSFRCGSSTTVYREWVLGGSDYFANGYAGGWQCAVIDPTSAGTTDSGTYSAASVQYMGIFYSGDGASKAGNVFVDSIMVGSGIRITNTEATSGKGWEEVVTYCTDRGTRAWGFVQQKEPGIYTVYGTLYVGDSTQAVATTLTDSAKVFKFADYEYYSTPSTQTLSSSVGNGFNGLTIEDASTKATTFQDGIVVGTASGRSGSTFIGVDNANTTFDLYGGSEATSSSKMYGTLFQQVDGGITMGNDADHEYFACTFAKCGQVDPVGAPEIRNCVFAETTDVDSALLWNENIDIQKCNFIANTTGAAIEHPSATGTPYTHTDLVMSANTNDVYNSSASPITVTKAGTSNGSSSEGSAVTFQSSLTITITVQDSDTDPIQNVVVGVFKVSDRFELVKEETTAAGIATEIYTGATPVDVEIRCRKASSADSPKYKSFSTLATLNGDFDLLVTLQEDPNNNATT